MKFFYFFFSSLLFGFSTKSQAQSFEPAPGNFGSTAIYKDSSIFVNWASAISLQRGFLDISNKGLGLSSFGSPENALYQAEGNSIDVVSLGDSGVAILTFNQAILNGSGYDFAVFENGFADNYIELAFVEVSSDGINYVRFPNVSEIPNAVQMGNFEFSDCRYVNNLAGKYRQGFGTPFDLNELKDSTKIDINNINFVKIIDVIGSIDSLYGTYDSQGNIINDPWPSGFDSGGFDLDALGVIHQRELGLEKITSSFSLKEYDEFIEITSNENFQYELLSLEGKIILSSSEPKNKFILTKLNSNELFILKLKTAQKVEIFKILF